MYASQTLAVLAAAAFTSVHALPYTWRSEAPPRPSATSLQDKDWFYAINTPSPVPTKSLPEDIQSSLTDFPKLTPNADYVEAFRQMPTGFSGSGFVKPTGYPAGGIFPTGRPFPTGSGFPYPTGRTWGHNGSHHSTGPTGTAASSTPLPTPLKGVNLGDWLILEPWMNSSIFENTDASDEWSFDETEGAEAKLKQHWETYITEDDIQDMAAWGINAVRIPIGYWAYDNSNTPYIMGADAYLEKAIGWCRKAGIKVLVDCHGSPGSQNGEMHSGHAGNVTWQDDGNLQQSIEVLKTMATKYGSQEYADVVFAIELVNEPKLGGDSGNSLHTTQQWAQKAFHVVRSAATNKDLRVVMHDGFEGAKEWHEVGKAINGDVSKADAKFVIDLHLYQNQGEAASKLTQQEHVEQACNYTSTDLDTSLPVYVGEFSAGTNICANPDGSTVAGTQCSTEGCQCSANVPIEYWNQPLVDATRKFVEAELDAFNRGSEGWFMWSWKGPGAWGLQNAIKYGIVGKNVDDRKFPGQCQYSGY